MVFGLFEEILRVLSNKPKTEIMTTKKRTLIFFNQKLLVNLIIGLLVIILICILSPFALFLCSAGSWYDYAANSKFIQNYGKDILGFLIVICIPTIFFVFYKPKK